MEVEPSSFETDPEGQALAAAINASLPPEVGRGLGQPETRGRARMRNQWGCEDGAGRSQPMELFRPAMLGLRAPLYGPFVASQARCSRPRLPSAFAAACTHFRLQVRVFSIQRVSKSWNARSECIRRWWVPTVGACCVAAKLHSAGSECIRRSSMAAALPSATMLSNASFPQLQQLPARLDAGPQAGWQIHCNLASFP